MANNNPDLLYLRSREDLLRYEDARFNSLVQAVADFYSTRNDQSIWGNFLRALAIELSKLDYDYSYDLVNKDPSLLTPPDIRRRWAAPLYVSSNWPSTGQFDTQYKQMLVDLITAYKEGTTVKAIHDVILAYTGISINVVELYKQIGNGVFDQSDRNSISVSVQVGGSSSDPTTTVTSLAQLQTIIQSLYNAIALAKPAHVGLEFTTIFGVGTGEGPTSESEGLQCMLAPQNVTAQQFALLPADQQIFYKQSGYAAINPALYWIGTTKFPLGSLLRDSNGNFQLLTSIGVYPNTSGILQPSWGTQTGDVTADNELTWRNVSPNVASTSVNSGVLTVTLGFAVPISTGMTVKLINLGTSTFLNGVPLTVTGTSNAGTTFTANFTYPDYGTIFEPSGTATFPLPSTISNVQFGELDTDWRSLYQELYTNFCCAPCAAGQLCCDQEAQGITDTLRIFIKQIEYPPFGPMLWIAPLSNFKLNPDGTPAKDSKGEPIPLNPANPKTTVAAYGRKLLAQLTAAQWTALPSIFVNILNGMADGTNATYSYVPTTQFLHEGEYVTVQGFSNAALNVTAPVHNVYNLVANIQQVAISSNILTVTAPNSFKPGMLVTFAGTGEPFLNGQTVVVTSATGTQFTANFASPDYINPSGVGTAEVSTFQISMTATAALQSPSVTADAGMLTPTLQSAYYLKSGNYILGDPPINTDLTSPAVGSSWVPGGTVFQGQIVVDPNGNQQLALNAGVSDVNAPFGGWNVSLNGVTLDGGVSWRNIGRGTFGDPSTWVMILNMGTGATPPPPTGEVGNVDPNMLYGLVAPRLDQVWEVSGGDQDFIFGLY